MSIQGGGHLLVTGHSLKGSILFGAFKIMHPVRSPHKITKCRNATALWKVYGSCTSRLCKDASSLLAASVLQREFRVFLLAFLGGEKSIDIS